jgi:SAM-dependent methyltransferase
MEIESIKEAIAKVEAITSSKEWFENLEERKKEEAEFHDFSHDDDTALDNKKFYTTTKLSTQYWEKWLKINTKDKVFLDYACGNGIESVKAAKLYGAKFVIGIDISPGSVANAKRLAEREGVSDKCVFYVGDCENTGLPDLSIDTVLCAGVLHHLDLNYVYPELSRIMKTGAKLLAGEALNYNPIIRAYRMRTPEMRTEWEKHHILDLKDVKKAKKHFKVGDVKFWHITSYIAAFLKKVPVIQKPALALFNGIDSILTKIPYLQRMAWIFTFELIKEKN